MTEIFYRILPIAASLALLIYVFVLLRGHRVRERYVYAWMLLASGMLVLSIFPKMAFVVARWLGFQAPSNMLLAACSLLLLLTVIGLSTSISALEEDRRRLVEEIAILDARVRSVETRAAQPGGSGAEGVAD